MTQQGVEAVRQQEKVTYARTDFDVVVVGGGIAGVAAAVAAARNGARSCIIEKGYALGGLATAGNVIIYLPLCDGLGNQLIGGLGEELLRLSVKDGFSQVPRCWEKDGNGAERQQKRFQTDFNPMSFMLELEDFITAEGITLYYDTRLCAVEKNGDRISSVIVENKDGRGAIKCRAVVDATGDADVCHLAGEDTVSWNTNVCSGWFYYFDGKEVVLEKFSLPYDQFGGHVPASGRGFAGDRAEDVTGLVLESRKLIKQKISGLKAVNPAVIPLFMPSIPTFRMTRRLKGAIELDRDNKRRYFTDSVGMTGNWRAREPGCCIPLRMLQAVKTGNLITAGRCVSAGSDTWDMMRAIPTCAATGEAAGTASALLCRHERGSFAKIDIAVLQEQLRRQRVILGPEAEWKDYGFMEMEIP